MGKLGLVAGTHQDHAGQGPHESDVKRSGMGRAVRADQARPVHGKPHRKALDRHVMDDLIIAALQEGRIDRGERLHAIGGEARGKGHGVLLGNADIKHPGRVRPGKEVEARAGIHSRRHRHDLVVTVGLLDQFLGKDLGIGRGRRLTLGLLAGDDVEPCHRMQLVGGTFGWRIALAFLRHHMNQHRFIADLPGIFQNRDQSLQVMTVDGANIVKAEFLKEGPACDHAPGIFLSLARGFLQGLGQDLGHRLARLAQRAISAARHQPGHIGTHPADRRGNRHVVVVQDHRQLAGGFAGIVHRLIGHARAHRAVTDDRNHLVVAPGRIARGAKSQGC